jgi:tetratricopeptide (TPR) repeat protein
MAQAPSPATQSADLPTIIIDPMLYEPEPPSQSQTAYGYLIRLTRVTLAATAVGTATLGVAYVTGLDSLLSKLQVGAATTALSGRATPKAQSRSATLAPPVRQAVEQAPLALPTPEAPVPVEAPDADEPVAIDVLAAGPTAAALSPALARAALQARASAPVAGASTELSVQAGVRNARRLLALNQLDQAEEAYRHVLTLSDNEPAALTGLARVLLARGQLDEAFTAAMRAVDKAPDVASGHLTLGDVLRARGDKAGAQAQYDQAAQLE